MKLVSFAATAALAAGAAHAAPLKTANLTKKVNEVRISESSRQARQASVGDRLTGSSTVLTGRQSRAELTFPDKTITRIGANAVFRFNSGSRDMEIKQGSFLLQVPKNAGGATIRTSTVTAAITGTTTMMEFSPDKWLKFICLEGTAKLRNKQGDSVDVPPGHMIVMHPDARNFPRPLIVNVKKMQKTSALMDEETFGPLNGNAQGAIDGTIAGQMDGKRNGSLQRGYILGSGDSVRIDDDGDNPNNLINGIGSHSGFDPEFPNGNPNNNPPVTGPGNNSPITGPNGP